MCGKDFRLAPNKNFRMKRRLLYHKFILWFSIIGSNRCTQKNIQKCSIGVSYDGDYIGASAPTSATKNFSDDEEFFVIYEQRV